MSRKPTLNRSTYAVWEITLRCNLSCEHCGSRAGAARPDELSTTEALALVDQLALPFRHPLGIVFEALPERRG